LDTNVLCQQDSNPKIRVWLSQHYLQSAISSVTVGEIARGIEALPMGPKRMQLDVFLNELLADYPVLPFGTAEALQWARYAQAAGRPLPILDSMIGATAQVHNLEVVTENTKDFPHVSTVNPAE
jgi:predicted nucleic acid-binding protein